MITKCFTVIFMPVPRCVTLACRPKRKSEISSQRITDVYQMYTNLSWGLVLLLGVYWYLHFSNRKLRLNEAMTVDYIADSNAKDLFTVYFTRTTQYTKDRTSANCSYYTKAQLWLT